MKEADEKKRINSGKANFNKLRTLAEKGLDEKKGVKRSWMLFKQTILAGDPTLWEVQDREQLTKLAKQNCAEF